VTVSPDGDALVVSERLSNRLETLLLDSEGRPGAPIVTASSGTVPFGFAFGHRDDLVVSEAGASTVSSYRDLDFSRDGRYLYAVSPTGRATGYSVGSDGSLEQVTSVPAGAGITGAAAARAAGLRDTSRRG
jgi:6-phosphogluconolactonase (cycloisomerase 2 family)